MRRAAVAVTLCLFVWVALLAPASVPAQDRGRSPEDLWKKYPLAPTAAPSAQPTAASTPAALDRDERAATSDNEDGAPGVVFGLLALLTAGGTILILRTRRRREGEPHAATALYATTPVRAVPVIPALWLGRSGRFTRATTRTTGSRATATVASARAQGRPAAGDAPVPRVGAVPLASEPSPMTPGAASGPAGSPPDRRLGWTAEIEWRHTDGESRFCVIARGAGTVVLAQSPPQEWPPTGPAAVLAMTDAAEQLAATLAAAGWKALPPGSAWYAKRFAWEPVVAERAVASPAKSTAAAAAKPVTSSSPATPLSARRGSGARHRLGSKLPRWQQVALLCVLVAVVPVAALTFSGGRDDAPAVRPAPAPVTKVPDSPAARPKPKPTSSNGIDLTIPLVVILGLVSIALAIRQTRRVLC